MKNPEVKPGDTICPPTHIMYTMTVLEVNPAGSLLVERISTGASAGIKVQFPWTKTYRKC